MNQIKFRAWDEENEVFWYWENDIIENAFWNKARIHKMPVMQYTGLNDMKGKEIYKDDIVMVGTHQFGGGNKRVVVWYRDGWRLGLVDCKENSCHCKHKTPSRINLSEWKKLLVIGNRYENPGWLEELKQ